MKRSFGTMAPCVLSCKPVRDKNTPPKKWSDSVLRGEDGGEEREKGEAEEGNEGGVKR